MDCMPLLAKLAAAGKGSVDVSKLSYDTETETSVCEAGWTPAAIGLTGSLVTNAGTDPTCDEPTDR